MPATYDKIQTFTIGSSTSSVTFTSIPGTYTDLVVIFSGGMATNGANMYARVNGDTGSNYSGTYVLGTAGNAAISARDSNLTGFPISVSGTQSTHTINQITTFMNYSNSSTFKTVLVRDNNANGSVGASALLYRGSTSAITSIVFFPSTGNISVNSLFTLYGIKAA